MGKTLALRGRGILTVVRFAACLVPLAIATTQACAVERDIDADPATFERGDYAWAPAISPAGPTLVFVDIATQLVHVYRNGALIGVSTASTGTRSHPTPTGVFRILERRTRHRSNLYDAEMPYMHRITWDGIALHAGDVARARSSHGCVRLPPAFAEHLFDVARRGTVVVISNTATPVRTTIDSQPPTLSPDATSGRTPITVVVSAAEGAATVFRGGQRIGRAKVAFRDDRTDFPTRAFMLMQNDGGMRRWIALWPVVFAVDAMGMRERFVVDEEFERRVLDLVAPGDVVVVTARRATAPDAALDLLSSE